MRSIKLCLSLLAIAVIVAVIASGQGGIQQPAHVLGAFSTNDCLKANASGFVVSNGAGCAGAFAAAGSVITDAQCWASATTLGVCINIILAGGVTYGPILFAALGAATAGKQNYCSDCTVTSGTDNTCAGSGTGAMAIRLNGAWKCEQ